MRSPESSNPWTSYKAKIESERFSLVVNDMNTAYQYVLESSCAKLTKKNWYYISPWGRHTTLRFKYSTALRKTLSIMNWMLLTAMYEFIPRSLSYGISLQEKHRQICSFTVWNYSKFPTTGCTIQSVSRNCIVIRDRCTQDFIGQVSLWDDFWNRN